MKKYQSETTQFLNKLKAQDPTLESRQLAGHQASRDKTLDLQQKESEHISKIMQKAYVYSTE